MHREIILCKIATEIKTDFGFLGYEMGAFTGTSNLKLQFFQLYPLQSHLVA
ncbi:hypothetical protein KPL37_02635 [Clostridium frigoris]|uniref:Uncharacterized protein n=1 Tax=Clostridium frigoris TaxID=205327 RepID=A0ABS6BP23_9CLOT|nr:hypothetical protein [Clostridium frigoris]MBU3158671.1 hypothetical protein [Clostridium frigoris]